MDTQNEVKLFLMQNLLVESDLAKLEKSGIDIGHIKTLNKNELVDEELFEAEIVKEAREMADFYSLYYSLENSIRRFISERLQEKYGGTWWDQKIPEEVKIEVKKRQKEENDSGMSIRSEDPLAYTTFGELIKIFNANWIDFSDTIRSQKAMGDILSKLNGIRGVVAHSCRLNKDEIDRFKLLIKDWLRIQS